MEKDSRKVVQVDRLFQSLPSPQLLEVVCLTTSFFKDYDLLREVIEKASCEKLVHKSLTETMPLIEELPVSSQIKILTGMEALYDAEVKIYNIRNKRGVNKDKKGGREMLKVGDRVGVMKQFYWYDEEPYMAGYQFVIQEQHIGHSFEKWVRKIK